MSDVRTPSKPGQNPDLSSASSLRPAELLAELRAFRRTFEGALPRLRAAIGLIESKLGVSGLDVTVTGDPPLPAPPFAVLCDGRMALSTDALGDRDLGEREIWMGVMLSASDVAFVVGRTENAAHETACQLIAEYSRTSKKPRGESESEDSDTEDNGTTLSCSVNLRGVSTPLRRRPLLL